MISGRLCSTLTELPIAKLVLGSHQPRKRFEVETLDSLAASIRTHGVLQPIIVRSVEVNKFEIVAGERRYFAAKAANLHTLPVVILQLNDGDTLEVSLMENLHRADLSEVEETEGILRLLALKLDRSMESTISFLYRMDNEARGRVTQSVLGSAEATLVTETFQRLNRMTWRSFVVTRLPLMKLPEDLLEAITTNDLSPAQARLLSNVADPYQRFALIQQVREEELTLGQLRERLRGAGRTVNPWKFALLRLREQLTQAETPRQQRALRLLEELEQLLIEDSPEA